MGAGEGGWDWGDVLPEGADEGVGEAGDVSEVAKGRFYRRLGGGEGGGGVQDDGRVAEFRGRGEMEQSSVLC